MRRVTPRSGPVPRPAVQVWKPLDEAVAWIDRGAWALVLDARPCGATGVLDHVDGSVATQALSDCLAQGATCGGDHRCEARDDVASQVGDLPPFREPAQHVHLDGARAGPLRDALQRPSARVRHFIGRHVATPGRGRAASADVRA
jgi:hypothetical protein